ncbi:WD40 repeat domain-containing protein [Umezawaea tangerina]|uniref:WD-40 repeat-containing protein n=1 Tax=Umezawaea tangerina TaxID=84725 RepID=A0A2T0SZT4_9PSEU|nr:WD40 repeat domain-containing protein [Umezawaea tangerina]PRY38904.1 WD-40 repeat-containing protein [Umezawaea tangerina]
MIEHHGPISGIAAYADRYVATAGYDNQVVLWDQATGRALSRSMHDHLVNQCAFSPDGRYLVTSSSDYTARLWSVPELDLLTVFRGAEDDVEMAVFHPTREWVATASRDFVARVHDFSGKLLREFKGHRADVVSVEWVDDGDELISSSDGGEIKRWSMATGALVEDVGLDGVEQTDATAVSRNVLYAGNDRGEIVVISEQGTAQVPAHEAGVKRLLLKADRDLLVSLSYDSTMRLWDISETIPKNIAETTFPVDVWPRSSAFAGESKLVFGTFGSKYRTYDYERQEWLAEEVPPTHGINGLCVWDDHVITVGDSGVVYRDGVPISETGSLCNFVLPTGPTILTGGQLGTVVDATDGRVLHRHHSPLNCGTTFTKDGSEHVAIGSYAGEALVFRWEGSTLVHVEDLKLHTSAIKGLVTSGDVLFSTSSDQSIAWHRITDFSELHRIEEAHERVANGCVAFDAGHFATVGRDLTLRTWTPEYECTTIRLPIRRSIRCVAASADGDVVAIGSYDGHIARYDPRTRGLLAIDRPTAAGISAMTFSSARDAFLASSYDGQVYEIPRTV